MGQQEVYDFLRKNPKTWFTSKEIAKHLSLSMGSVTSNLKKLRKSHSIAFHLESRQGKRNYIYSFKNLQTNVEELEVAPPLVH